MSDGEDVTEPHDPATPIVGLVAREQVQFGIDGYVVNIAQTMGENFQLRSIRTTPRNAATQKLNRFAISSDCIHESIIAGRNIQPAVDPHLNTVDGVIGAARL